MNVQQRQAAQLVSLGWGNTAVAKQLGVGTKTVQRWRKLDGFEDLTKREVEPSIRAVLEDAMQHAHKRDGSPDYGVRITAAKALMQLPDAPLTLPDAPAPPLVIYA